MEKKNATNAGKKVKKSSQPKKAPTSPEFIDSNEEGEEEGLAKDDKGKKIPPLLRGERRSQKLF